APWTCLYPTRRPAVARPWSKGRIKRPSWSNGARPIAASDKWPSRSHGSSETRNEKLETKNWHVGGKQVESAHTCQRLEVFGHEEACHCALCGVFGRGRCPTAWWP